MKKFDILKCKECSGLIEVVLDVCCEEKCCEDGSCGEMHHEQKFEKLEEKTADSTVEKHVPFIEEHNDGYVVKIGKETAHPMTAEHYIQFIEIIIDGDRLYRKYLKPGDEPMACFKVEKGKEVVAREHCNIHGLWKS